MQLARAPIGLLSASVALAFVALMGVATALVAVLLPYVGFPLAVVIVTALAGGASWLLFLEGRKRLEVALEPPSLLRHRSDK